MICRDIPSSPIKHEPNSLPGMSAWGQQETWAGQDPLPTRPCYFGARPWCPGSFFRGLRQQPAPANHTASATASTRSSCPPERAVSRIPALRRQPRLERLQLAHGRAGKRQAIGDFEPPVFERRRQPPHNFRLLHGDHAVGAPRSLGLGGPAQGSAPARPGIETDSKDEETRVITSSRMLHLQFVKDGNGDCRFRTDD